MKLDGDMTNEMKYGKNNILVSSCTVCHVAIEIFATEKCKSFQGPTWQHEMKTTRWNFHTLTIFSHWVPLPAPGPPRTNTTIGFGISVLKSRRSVWLICQVRLSMVKVGRISPEIIFADFRGMFSLGKQMRIYAKIKVMILITSFSSRVSRGSGWSWNFVFSSLKSFQNAALRVDKLHKIHALVSGRYRSRYHRKCISQLAASNVTTRGLITVQVCSPWD